jgi:hypothetical protein
MKLTTIANKKKLATFMDFPSKKLRGKITDEVADSMYSSVSDLMDVVDAIEADKNITFTIKRNAVTVRFEKEGISHEFESDNRYETLFKAVLSVVEAKLEKKVSAKDPKSGLIPPTKIVIEDVEGGAWRSFPKTIHFEPGKVKEGYREANTELLVVYSAWSSGGNDMGYDKASFTIHFEDGAVYNGRLDISRKTDNPTTTSNVIGEHVYEHLDNYINNPEATFISQKQKDELKVWANYDFGVGKPLKTGGIRIQ